MTLVAVTGTGSAGMKHLAALSRIAGVQPIAVPQRSERRQQLEALGYATAADLDQVIKSGATHCIVATDSGRHLEDCNKALGGGLHVLCEKPLALGATEANEIRHRAVQAGRVLYVGCVLRFSESLNVFRQQLPEIGRIHSVRIEYQSYLPDWRPARDYRQSYSARLGEGGVLLDLTHEIDYAGWLFGWPDSVFARVRNLDRLGIGACEIAELSWQTPDGCLVSIGIDYLSRPQHRTIRAYGENGAISWDWHAGKVELALVGGEPAVSNSIQNVDDMFLIQAEAFIQMSSGQTSDDSESNIATADDGAKAIAICDAAMRSSDLKSEETVTYK